MRLSWNLAPSIACLFLAPGLSQAAEPEQKASKASDPVAVAAAIDHALDKHLAKERIPASAAASDAEFLRRAYLDLTGRISTAEQARAFLDSKDPDKRTKLLDELLASPNYGLYFGTLWSDLIVQRDDDNRALNTVPLKGWLADAFNANRGWDTIVRDLLSAKGTMAENAAATFYLANRKVTVVAPDKVAGTTANLFMGIQLQCAQCHNHVFISDWKQTDFWGVAAFFSQTRATGNPRGGGPWTIGEEAGPAQIEIPDANDLRARTGKIVKAKFFLGKEPALGEKGPHRPAFADWLVAADNKYFAPAAVNRLWAHFFAYSFVNAIDDMHDDNAPSHPELLQLLADELRASGFDLKHLIRSICNSKAYQRTSKPLKANAQDTRFFSRQTVKVMKPEVLCDSLYLALGIAELRPSAGDPVRGFGIELRRRPGTSPREAFLNFFTAKADGDDATEMRLGIPQYLRLMNSQPFNEGAAVIDKLIKDGAGADKVIESLFLTTLSRRPTAAEAKKMAAFVAKKQAPKAGYIGVLWVLINSAEFVCIR